MRWLRASRLWRTIFNKWTARAREQLRVRREAAAVVAMEERRKRYQADAQQRLAWVEEGLAQRVVEDSTCPVCCADAGGLPISCPCLHCEAAAVCAVCELGPDLPVHVFMLHDAHI